MATLNARITVRSDSTENWRTADSVPSPGELAFDSSTGRVRIGQQYGEGAAPYRQLPTVNPRRVFVPPVRTGVTTFDDNLATTAGSPTLVCYDPAFDDSMIGHTVVICGAGTDGAPHITTIVAVAGDGESCTLNDNAVSEVDGVDGYLGFDNATIIEDAVAHWAAGDVIHFPAGNFLTSWMPEIVDFLYIEGEGREATNVYWAGGENHCLEGTDVQSITLRNFSIHGPERSGFANGVNIDKSENPANFWLYFEAFGTHGFYDGINIDTPIVSHFDRVLTFKAANWGFDVHGEGDSAGTSCTFTSCFPAGCWGGGFHIRQMAYVTLNGCAADANGVGYWYQNCPGVTENGCGSEETYDFGPDGLQRSEVTPNGLSRMVQNSKVVMNSPYMIGNVGTAIYVWANSRVTINSPYEGSPGNPDDPNSDPQNFLVVEPADEPNEILRSQVILSNPYVTGDIVAPDGDLIVLDDVLATGVGFVNHEADDSVARPAGYAMVIWKGSVTPTNMAANDLYVSTA